MPPAAKKKKLTQVATETPSAVGSGLGSALVGVSHNVILRCRRTSAYADAYSATTLVAAKQANKRIGTTRWYCLNKDALVTILVLNRFAKRIQSFYRGAAMARARFDTDIDITETCPISLEAVSDISKGLRYMHTNT